MPDEERKKGTFWGTLIGAVLASLVASGALSSFVNWGTSEKAAEQAKVAVEKDARDQARAEAEKLEKAFATYIEKEIEPKFVATVAEIDADIADLDAEVVECRTKLRETTILAEAALRLAERRMGRRAIERELERVDNSEPKVASHPPRPKKPPPKFDPFEQHALPAERE